MDTQENRSQPKLGAGHASAMFRQGLSELRGALYPESNVAQSPEYGLYGTKTPGEVWEEKKMDARDFDGDRPGGIEERIRMADPPADRGRDDRRMEMSRE